MGYLDSTRQREYQRNWIARRRSEFFSDKQCVMCGGVEQLELDHIDPSEKTTHNIWSWSEPRRLSEIAKCQVLCRKCHKEKTYTVDLPKIRGYTYGEHGRTRYRCGCRCEVCREDHRLAKRGVKKKSLV